MAQFGKALDTIRTDEAQTMKADGYARLGWTLPRRLVFPRGAFSIGTDEESRANSSHASRTDPELVPRPGTISSGTFEGLNSKAKLALKKASGLRIRKSPCILSSGELPEPKTANEFC
jgi:hypothetical protein